MGVKDKTRIVHYNFCACGIHNKDFIAGDFVMDVDTVLKKVYNDGVITNFDDGRGRCPWFEGTPGKQIRKLRDLFKNAERKQSC